jgi:hypothetical protein
MSISSFLAVGSNMAPKQDLDEEPRFTRRIVAQGSLRGAP